MRRAWVVGYDDVHQAEEVRLRLLKLQRDYLVDRGMPSWRSDSRTARFNCTRSIT